MTFYKDFNKDVKDLLTKNFADAGKWKVESKFKGPKDTLFINPQATNNGANVDVEYAPSCCGAKVKVNVTPDSSFKLTTTYEDKGHKVEASYAKSGEWDVTYDGKIEKIAITEKVSAKAVESAVSYATCAKSNVGVSVSYPLTKDGALSWTAGARYADAGRLVSIVTDKLKTYTTGVALPVTILGGKSTVGAQFDCSKGSFGAQVGVETPCILFPKNTLKVRVNKDLKWAATYITKLPDSWKAALSFDAQLKPGLTLTRE